MTTYYPFQPSAKTVPTFTPTLDGNGYLCSVTWNFAAQRWYLNCFDQNNALVFSVAVVETPGAIALASLSWTEVSGLVSATTVAPHGYSIGAVVMLTVANANPTAYNGAYLCTIIGPSAFTYPLASDPGLNVAPGAASQLINMSGGYFTSSTLIYRAGNFEVSP